MELIEAVSMVFITLLLTVTSQTPQLNCTCPVLTTNIPCQCATLSAHVLDKVQVHCEILKFNENTPDFSAIQTEHTEVLYLKCDSLLNSRFHDNMFSHLHELRELSFIGCKVDRLYPETLRGLDRLRVLNISYDYNIDFKIEADSFKFTPNLNFLDLSSMLIKELPRSVLCDAENMTYVDLSTNQLQSEETIGYLSESESKVCLGNLKTLKLDGNLLSELTLPLVKHIPDIAKLDLNHNRLTTLASQLFANLTSLQVINLSHNLLPQLPSDIFLGLESLQAVGLDGNQLTCLSPTMFIDNTNLSVINLGQNRLTAECLPNINHLVALQVLDLSFNQIQNIPRDFLNFTSGSSSIEFLYLEGNQLSVIEPDVFHATPFLQFINLSSNSLLRFTPDTELNQLHTLDISNNLLTHKDLLRLDWNLTSNLVQLLISNNKLFQVPQPKVTMHKLVILKLDKNNLTEIADADFRKFPALKLLHLQDNYLRYLPKMTSLPDLNYLDLSWNYLDTVEYGAFSQLHQLQVLNLNYNKLTDIHSLFSTSSVLGVFYVKHNLLHTVSSTDVPSQVIHLDLSQNKITSIAVDLLLNLPRLTLADFKENQLRRIYQTSLLLPRPNSHRPFILLSGNYLFCDCNMRYLQDLNDQRPTANGYRYAFIGDITGVLCESLTPGKMFKFLVDLQDNDFLCSYCSSEDCGSIDRYCQYGCDCCELDVCNCMQKCPPTCVCTYNTDRTYQTVNCSSKGLTEIPANPLYFATHISFDGNNMTSLQENAFQHDHNVQVLHLNNSNIQEIQPLSFTNLTRLNTLFLNDNALQEIQNSTFASLVRLRSLFLQNNKIHRIENEAFAELTYLEELHLNNNDLATIDIEVLDSLSHVSALYLANNSWKCDCRFGLQFQTWLAQHSQQVKDIPSCKTLDDKVTVNSSTEFRVTWLNFDPCKNLTSEIRVGRLSKTLLSIIITLVIILVLFVTCLILLYKYRDLFLVWLYTRYGVRLHKVQEDQDKDYDAFISYSSLDESFVVRELAPLLEEGDPPYRLCLHYRDWIIGSVIAESIISSVHSSRRTILLLSKNFIDSEWCNYEFQTAHHQVLKDKTCRLIVVLLDDEPPPGLDEHLKLYIKSHTYIRRSDPWFAKRLRYALPDVSEEQKVARWEAKRKEKEMLEKTREVMISLNISNVTYTKT